MRFTIHILLILISFSCNKKSANTSFENTEDKITRDTIQLSKLPEIGDFISDSIKLTSGNSGHLINSGQFSPSSTINYSGWTFDIAWNNNNLISYIITTDTNFTTEEGVKINMTLKELKTIQNNQTLKEPGWAYYMNLNSGWNVAFNVGSSSTDRELLETDSVKWIFKR